MTQQNTSSCCNEIATSQDFGELYHVVLKITGSKQKQEFFNYALGDLDSDWPYNPDKAQPPAKCKVCGGVQYRLPYFNTKQLKLFAKQINSMPGVPGHLKVKVRKFTRAQTCLGKLKKASECS